MGRFIFLSIVVLISNVQALNDYKENAFIFGNDMNSANEIKPRFKRDVTKNFEYALSQCGTRKSCYVSLKSCDSDPKTCNFVLNWDYDGNLINYELTGLSYFWIGVAFSEDIYWGDDNAVICSRNPDTGRLAIDQYFKPKPDSSPMIQLSPNQLLNTHITYDEIGLISCKFSRTKASENRYVTDMNKPHYIYVERGAPGETVGEKLGSKFQPSDNKVEFAKSVYVPTSSRSWLVKLHAILGIIAWILLGSIGILIARYYKPLWPNHVLQSFRVWFTFHRSLMVFVTLLTLLSFLFALIEMDWVWSKSGHDLLHATLGIIVIICSCINPILGFFRPQPDTSLRCVFFWLHWIIGAVAYCLAVPTIFIGMDLAKSDIPNWCAWLLFAWVIFHIIVEIVLEVHYCCTFTQLSGNLNEKNIDYDQINKPSNKKKFPPGFRWKPSLLFAYAVVTAIVVCALVIAIIVND